MRFTPSQVEEAIARAFPSEDRLYDEIGWEENVNSLSKDEAVSEYLQNEYASITDLLDWVELRYELKKPQSIVIDGNVTEIVCVEQLGGMDEGTTADITFKVGDQYFTKEGWYASHYGYEYDGDFYESQAFEKTIIEYRRRT